MSEQLASHKIDALIVSSPASIRYLSGYAGSNGLMLISKTDEHFFTDPRYGARHLKRAIERNLVFALANLVATGQVLSGDQVEVTMGDDGALAFSKAAQSAPPQAAQNAAGGGAS